EVGEGDAHLFGTVVMDRVGHFLLQQLERLAVRQGVDADHDDVLAVVGEKPRVVLGGCGLGVGGAGGRVGGRDESRPPSKTAVAGGRPGVSSWRGEGASGGGGSGDEGTDTPRLRGPTRAAEGGGIFARRRGVRKPPAARKRK